MPEVITALHLMRQGRGRCNAIARGRGVRDGGVCLEDSDVVADDFAKQEVLNVFRVMECD